MDLAALPAVTLLSELPGLDPAARARRRTSNMFKVELDLPTESMPAFDSAMKAHGAPTAAPRHR